MTFGLKIWLTDQVSRHLPIAGLTPTLPNVGAQPDEKTILEEVFLPHYGMQEGKSTFHAYKDGAHGFS